MKAALTVALVGAAGYLAWRWWQHEQFKRSLGQRTYDSLAALQPSVTAPVIRVPLPTLAL